MKLLTKFKGIILQQSLILLIPSVWTVEDYISVEISFEIGQDITTQIREKNNTGHGKKSKLLKRQYDCDFNNMIMKLPLIICFKN